MKLTCIRCPMSCIIEINEREDDVLDIKGYECELGRRYAIEELRNPMRILTTTVAVRNGLHPVLPVKTEREIPKHLILDGIKILSKISVEAPIHYGDIIYSNILDTGVDVIASRDIDAI